MLPEYDFSKGIRGKYADKFPKRQSLRLPNYDYRQNGAYFVTICIQNKKCLLGKIINEKMHPNEAGFMVVKWWNELANKFRMIELGEYVVMPNHFHGILNISRGDPMWSPANGRALRPAPTLGKMIAWFKTMSTNEYIHNVRQNSWPEFYQRLWHRNYYEHVIRNGNSLHRMREYIVNNPLKWELDELNPNKIHDC